MPISYRVDDNLALVVVRAWGTIDDASILAHAERFCSDPALPRTYHQLADFTGVTDFGGLTATGMREGAHRLDAFERETPGIRLALVMGSLAAYGMGRMYQMLRRAPVEIGVFRDHASALTWLGRADTSIPWLLQPPS